MIKAAVETHSELLAAASPCRQTSCQRAGPVARLRSSGQAAAGCCRDRDPRSCVPNPPSPNTRVAAAAGGKKLRAAGPGLGTTHPLAGGGEVGDAAERQPPTLPRARGLRPTAANGDPTPGSADGKSRANFCAPERLGSFSAAEAACPCARSGGGPAHGSHAGTAHVDPAHRRADGGGSQRQGPGPRGLRHTADPGPPGAGGQGHGGRAARTVPPAERGSAHPRSGEVCRRASLSLQWYFIYSRVCLARAV